MGFGFAAATMAQTRLEKTQKAAEGKRPVSYSVVITCRPRGLGRGLGYSRRFGYSGARARVLGLGLGLGYSG